MLTMKTSMPSTKEMVKRSSGSSRSPHNCVRSFRLDNSSSLTRVSIQLLSYILLRLTSTTSTAVAPWFGHANYPAGAYWKVNQQVGSMIDWYYESCFVPIQRFYSHAPIGTMCSSTIRDLRSTQLALVFSHLLRRLSLTRLYFK
jgi:hypothetical protein